MTTRRHPVIPALRDPAEVTPQASPIPSKDPRQELADTAAAYRRLLTAAQAEVERHSASHDEGKCPCELCSVVKSLT